MSLLNRVPVYVVNGFLESGKTSFVQETLSDPYFSDGGNTLLIACEEGEEEYDDHILESYDVTLVTALEKEAFTVEFLEDCRKKYKPTQVMIEYNGMWGMQLLRDIQMPKGWFLAQGITLVNAGTFDLYMQNMKSLFMDMAQDSDLVIFNRCVEGTKAASYKRNIRAANPRAQVEFEKEGGELFEYEEELPFDLEADIIEIGDIDYGIWYLDAMDHPEHYEGKTVRFKAMVMKPKGLEPGFFAPGRRAMTCCADDTVFLGFLCKSQNLDKLRNKQWLTVTAKVKSEVRKEYSGEEGPVLYTKALKSADKPEEEMVYF
ncbi:MAG: GTPase [Lachnospiraceae bacterium]|jgi:putative membrane protein|nr:GTPase [Lachnospiraceae bacterium]